MLRRLERRHLPEVPGLSSGGGTFLDLSPVVAVDGGGGGGGG